MASRTCIVPECVAGQEAEGGELPGRGLRAEGRAQRAGHQGGAHRRDPRGPTRVIIGRRRRRAIGTGERRRATRQVIGQREVPQRRLGDGHQPATGVVAVRRRHRLLAAHGRARKIHQPPGPVVEEPPHCRRRR